MYCWSRKTLVTIHWAHLSDWVAFASPKTTNRTLFLTSAAMFIMTLQWRHCNEIHSWYGIQNKFPYLNVYFQIFTLLKLTESPRFVTYLWNDPRIWRWRMLWLWVVINHLKLLEMTPFDIHHNNPQLSIFYHFWDIQRLIMTRPWNLIQGQFPCITVSVRIKTSIRG